MMKVMENTVLYVSKEAHQIAHCSRSISNPYLFIDIIEYENEDPSMTEMMDKIGDKSDKVDDSWSNKEKIEAFDEELKMKKKERDDEIAADQAKYNAEEEAEKEKIEAKKIQYVAPGLDLFTEKFLANFSAKNLSLEKDFSYTQKRERLKELGIDEETISQVMGKQ